MKCNTDFEQTFTFADIKSNYIEFCFASVGLVHGINNSFGFLDWLQVVEVSELLLLPAIPTGNEMVSGLQEISKLSPQTF